MNKLLAMIAATFLALTAIASGAEAGGCHHGGGGGFYRAMRHVSFQTHVKRRRAEIARRDTGGSKVAEKKVSKPVTEAKAEPAAEPAIDEVATADQSENSSIAGAAGQLSEATIAPPVAAKPVQKVASVKDVGCKKFFASAGMTLSVPCE